MDEVVSAVWACFGTGFSLMILSVRNWLRTKWSSHKTVAGFSTGRIAGLGNSHNMDLQNRMVQTVRNGTFLQVDWHYS